MAEKKTTKKTAAEPKKMTVKKASTTKKVAVALNTENVGFKAGDVYQALAVAACSMSIEEISKAASISIEETLLGIGWLFKEGKIVSVEDNKIALA